MFFLRLIVFYKNTLGPVYQLPEELSPDVFPWLAKHIWFDSHIVKHEDISTYFLAKNKSDIRAKTQTFNVRWVDNYDCFELDGKLEPVSTMPWSFLGDINIVHKHKRTIEKKFSEWWSEEFRQKDSTTG